MCGQTWPVVNMTVMNRQRREASRVHGSRRCEPDPERLPGGHRMSGRTERWMRKRSRASKKDLRTARDVARACATCHMVPSVTGVCACPD
jgi:hypothetical protein